MVDFPPVLPSDPKLPIRPAQQISIIDFNKNPPENTYSERSAILDVPSCIVGPAQYFLPYSTFLRDVDAVWAGDEQWPGQELPVQGQRAGGVRPVACLTRFCTAAWTTFALGPKSVVTFYFTSAGNPSNETWLGWDLVVQTGQNQSNIGVKTRFADCVYSGVTADFFAGAGSPKCSHSSQQAASAMVMLPRLVTRTAGRTRVRV